MGTCGWSGCDGAGWCITTDTQQSAEGGRGVKGGAGATATPHHGNGCLVILRDWPIGTFTVHLNCISAPLTWVCSIDKGICVCYTHYDEPMEECNYTKYIYSSTVLQYNFEVLVLYLRISIFCYST